MPIEGRFHRQTHRVADHVVPHLRQLREGDGTLGLDDISGENGMLDHVLEQVDGLTPTGTRHGKRPTTSVRRDAGPDGAAQHLRLTGDGVRGSTLRALHRRADHQRGDPGQVLRLGRGAA